VNPGRAEGGGWGVERQCCIRAKLRSSRVVMQDGVATAAREDVSLTVDELKVLKSQDMRYVQTVLRAEEKVSSPQRVAVA